MKPIASIRIRQAILLLLSGLSCQHLLAQNPKAPMPAPENKASSAWAGTYPFTGFSAVESRNTAAPPLLSDGVPFLSQHDAGAPSYQLYPFNSLISVRFDGPSYTVRDAVNKVLAFVGYSLLDSGSNTCSHVSELLSSPLPVVHRRFEGVSVREVLRALAGPGYITAVDSVRRKVTFDALPLSYSNTALQSDTSAPNRPAGVTDDEVVSATPDIERKSIAPNHPKTPLRTQDEIYNEASHSLVRDSSGQPVGASGGDYLGAIEEEGIKKGGVISKTRRNDPILSQAAFRSPGSTHPATKTYPIFINEGEK